MDSTDRSARVDDSVRDVVGIDDARIAGEVRDELADAVDVDGLGDAFAVRDGIELGDCAVVAFAAFARLLRGFFGFTADPLLVGNVPASAVECVAVDDVRGDVPEARRAYVPDEPAPFHAPLRPRGRLPFPRDCHAGGGDEPGGGAGGAGAPRTASTICVT